MSYIVYLFNTALQYSYVALTMLPSASGSVVCSKHMKHDHTSLRFRNRGIAIILNPGGFGGWSPPIRAEQGIYAENVEYNLKK